MVRLSSRARSLIRDGSHAKSWASHSSPRRPAPSSAASGCGASHRTAPISSSPATTSAAVCGRGPRTWSRSSLAPGPSMKSVPLSRGRWKQSPGRASTRRAGWRQMTSASSTWRPDNPGEGGPQAHHLAVGRLQKLEKPSRFVLREPRRPGRHHQRHASGLHRRRSGSWYRRLRDRRRRGVVTDRRAPRRYRTA
jgi:hypothetical protein